MDLNKLKEQSISYKLTSLAKGMEMHTNMQTQVGMHRLGFSLENPKRKNNMRNKECVCGSRKKFKKCCWSKYE